jgi:hypothetical protein
LNLTEDWTRTADVIPLWVREHERSEPLDAQAGELALDMSLRRPLVYEHGAFRHL